MMDHRKQFHHVGLEYWHQNIKSIVERIRSEKKLRKVKKKLENALSPRRVDGCMKQLSVRPIVILRRMHIPKHWHHQRSSKNVQKASNSDGPTAVVEASCQSGYTKCSLTQRDDVPELLAEAVGPRLNVACQAKKPGIELKIKMGKIKKGEECAKSSKMQLDEDNDEGNKVSSSVDSITEVLRTPTKTSVKMSVASKNNSIQDEELTSPNKRKSMETEEPNLSKQHTRICSAKSPRISRVISTDTPEEPTEQNRTVSDSSLSDQNIRTVMAEKLERIRAKFKLHNNRKVRRTSIVGCRDKWKKQRCETTAHLSFLSDTDQESDITASTLDGDESTNDMNDMNESSITRDESEEGSTLRDSSCMSNIEDDDERKISSTISSNTKKRSGPNSTPSRHMERDLLTISRVKSGSGKHSKWKVKKDRRAQDKRRSRGNSIDSGICDREASPSQSSLPIMGGLPRLDDNDENGDDSESKVHSCVSPLQPVNKLQSLNLDDLIRQQTKLQGMLDEFFCERTDSLEKRNDMCIKTPSIISDATSVPSPDSSIIEDADVNSTNSAVTNIPSECMNTQNEKVSIGNCGNKIEEGKGDCIKEKTNSSSLNEEVREKITDKRQVEDVNKNSKSENTACPLKVISSSKEELIPNTLLNEKRCEGSSDLMKLQSKEYHSAQKDHKDSQKNENISNQSILPPKKRPFINTDCFDNNSERINSPISTSLSTQNSNELTADRDCVTPVTAKKQMVEAKVSGKPAERSIHQDESLQVSLTPIINKQPQSSVQLHSPMEHCQAQPQALVVNLATTMQQSHTIVVDNNTSRPIGIISYVQKIDNPNVPVMQKETNNLQVQYPSISIPSTISSSVPITTTLSTSIHIPTTISTLAGDKLQISNLVQSPDTPTTSSMGLSIQSSPHMSELPLNHQNPIGHQSMSKPVPAKPATNSLRMTDIDREVIKYTVSIVKNLILYRACNSSSRNSVPQSDQRKLTMNYLIEIVHAMRRIQELQMHWSITDVFTYIAAYSHRIMPRINAVTITELNAVYKIYADARSSTAQSLNVQSDHHLHCNPMCPPSYTHYNHCIVQNSSHIPIQSAPPLLPPPPPPQPRSQPRRRPAQKSKSSPSTSNNSYLGMTGTKPQPVLTCALIPKTTPSSIVHTPQEPLPLLSAAQFQLLQIQILTYRNICSSLKLELDKKRNTALYNESLRQLQLQQLIAIRQQQQQAASQLPQQHPVHLQICQNPIPEREQQQSAIDKPIHEKLDNEKNNLVSHPGSESTQSDPNRSVTECNKIAEGNAVAKLKPLQPALIASPDTTSSVITTPATSLKDSRSSIGSVLTTSVEVKQEPNVEEYIEPVREKESDMNENSIGTKNMKEELVKTPRIIVKDEASETRNAPSTTDSLNKDQNSIHRNIKNEQSYIAEIITLDDDSSDDDVDCKSGTSTLRGTVLHHTDTKIDEIKYNQSSIDEELECEALSKKMGIQSSSYFQDTPINAGGIPVITSVTMIDNHTFEHFDESLDNNFMHEDIIDITDVAVKSESNIASPHSDCSETASGFMGEMIQKSEPRPNCSNCKRKKGEVICECREIVYCSGQCLKMHWRKFHSNICKGPPIHIDAIDEIILDDD